MKKRLLFKTAKEGREKLIALYAKESETTGGEFAGWIESHLNDEIDHSVPLDILPIAKARGFFIPLR